VKREELEKVAELIHDRKTVFIWGMGLTQHAHGTDNITALVNLALLTGNIGKPGCGLSPLRGQNNVQGAGDMGALPNLLPGHMTVEDEAARIHVGSLWNAVLSSRGGFSAPEMIHEIASGKIRALYVIGENPAVSEPQSTFVTWMLQRLDLLIVQDIFPTETTKYAHIVLPAAKKRYLYQRRPPDSVHGRRAQTSRGSQIGLANSSGHGKCHGSKLAIYVDRRHLGRNSESSTGIQRGEPQTLERLCRDLLALL
jgi:hypothetical protein